MTDVDASRRTFVAGAALATAAAATARTLAQDGPKHPDAPTAPAATDYPRRPLPVQRQPWPGLASQMKPRPDHGRRDQ